MVCKSFFLVGGILLMGVWSVWSIKSGVDGRNMSWGVI